MDFYLRLQRRGNAAILRFRELDSLRDRFRREPSAGKNVMNVHRRVLAWIVVTAFARNLHRVASYLLPFLFENAGDVSRGARTKRDEQQFNWRRSCRALRAGIEHERATARRDAHEEIVSNKLHYCFARRRHQSTPAQE